MTIRFSIDGISISGSGAEKISTASELCAMDKRLIYVGDAENSNGELFHDAFLHVLNPTTFYTVEEVSKIDENLFWLGTKWHDFDENSPILKKLYETYHDEVYVGDVCDGTGHIGTVWHDTYKKCLSSGKLYTKMEDGSHFLINRGEECFSVPDRYGFRIVVKTPKLPDKHYAFRIGICAFNQWNHLQYCAGKNQKVLHNLDPDYTNFLYPDEYMKFEEYPDLVKAYPRSYSEDGFLNLNRSCTILRYINYDNLNIEEELRKIELCKKAEIILEPNNKKCLFILGMLFVNGVAIKILNEKDLNLEETNKSFSMMPYVWSKIGDSSFPAVDYSNVKTEMDKRVENIKRIGVRLHKIVNNQTDNKIFLICPVRNATEEQRKWIEDFVREKYRERYRIHAPHIHTRQTDLFGGYTICVQNAEAIAEAVEVDLYYDQFSTGSVFDLGVAYALHKPLRVLNKDDITFNDGDMIDSIIKNWPYNETKEESYQYVLNKENK